MTSSLWAADGRLTGKLVNPGMAQQFSGRVAEVLNPMAYADEDTLRMTDSFRAFTKEALGIFVPGDVIWGWHIDAVCDHLQAVSEGKIQNLIINIPPRCLKSSVASVCWTAWEWIKNPKLRYIFTAYDLNLSMRDNLATRDLIKSRWYKDRWGSIYQIRPDVDAKKLFENTAGGRRLASSVTSGNTGEGGERIVVDDPHDVNKSENENDREQVIRWWSNTMSTRVNRSDASRVIIAQRVHHQDLTGYVIERMRAGGEQYELLILPMEYEPKLIVPMASLRAPAQPDRYVEYDEVDDIDDIERILSDEENEGVGTIDPLELLMRPDKVSPQAVVPDETSIGFKDPRQATGELLIPKQWPRRTITQRKFMLGPYAYSAQFQQSPSPSEGGQFKERYWMRYEYTPLYHRGLRPEIISVDSSYGTDDGDYTGVSVWGTFGGRLYVLDARRWREETPILRRKLRDLYAKWQVPFLIEKKANGIPLIQDLRRGSDDGSLPSLPVIEFDPDGMKKEARAYSVVSFVAGGLVYLPEGAEWVDEWILEHSQFPKGANDDLVDTTAMAITWLAKRTAAIRELFEKPYPNRYGERAVASGQAKAFLTR